MNGTHFDPESRALAIDPAGIKDAARRIVEFLLASEGQSILEATVYRSSGSKVWQATFTGPNGGQIWRSTGLTNKRQALLVARRWEARARRERESRQAKTPIVRAGRAEKRFSLSQREIATIMQLSERAIRNIERRAVKKLMAHPELRQAWQRYLSGQLEEDEFAFTPQEVEALFSLAQTPEERLVIRKVLRLIES